MAEVGMKQTYAARSIQRHWVQYVILIRGRAMGAVIGEASLESCPMGDAADMSGCMNGPACTGSLLQSSIICDHQI